MTVYCLLDKSSKERVLPQLFDLLHENMRCIAPSGLPYSQERQQWLCAVGPALEKAPRQILLCIQDGQLLGFLQYYTRDTLLMVEELQIKQDYRCSTVLFGFCRHLRKLLPEAIQTIEAYADMRNGASAAMMERLGMACCGLEGGFLHMRGSRQTMGKIFLHK